MKKITCDSCGSDKATSFKYLKEGSYKSIDLCMNCVQDFVLKNQTKLLETVDTPMGEAVKRVIHG